MGEPVAIIAILLLVIRELISFLKEKRISNNKKNWDGTERRTASVEEINNSIQLLVLPILNKQTEILVALEKLARENSDKMLSMNHLLAFGVNGLKENQEKMRTNLHAINGDMQQAVGILEDIQRVVRKDS